MNTFLTRWLALGGVVVLAACGTSSGPRAPASPAAGPTTPAASAATSSMALTAKQYQQDFAQHLTRANADHVFEGVPPNPLYAIIVMEVELGRDGRVLNVKPVRVPAHGQAQYRIARESVLRAQPYPKPSVTVALGKSKLALTETWLFDRESRFQLRTLALPQQGE